MSEVIDLTTAKEYLRVTHSQHDSLIQRHINTAEQRIFRYLLGDAETELTVDSYYYEFGDGQTNRASLELAVLMATKVLYDQPDTDPMTEAVRAVLRPLRPPQAG